jgi:23S rRNA pseudouridine955/2504/2580 synthase
MATGSRARGIIKMNLEKFIFYKDDDYLAVNKPADISTLEDRHSNINLLREVRKKFEFAQVCHRLDKGTTGVLVLARNDRAYRHLSIQFQERKVRKVYHAIVSGKRIFEQMRVEFPLYISGSGKVRIDKKIGKQAVTDLDTLETYDHCTLVECLPLTGRKHQIRVHLSALGHPIISDDIYKGRPLYLSSFKKQYKPKQGIEKPLIERVALHAYQIEFAGVSGNTVSLTAVYPKDFEIAVKQLRKFSRR